MDYKKLWMGCLVAALMSGTAVPAVADDAGKTDTAAAPADEAVEQFSCRYERPTGSRKAVKVCRAKSSIDEDADGSRRAIDKIKQYGNAGITPPNG